MGRLIQNRGLSGDRHHRGLHECDCFFGAMGVGEDIAAAYGDGASAPNDVSARDEAFARSGEQKVDFKFNAQYADIEWHEAQCGIATGAIDDGGDDACMQKAVLLAEVGAVGECDFDCAGGDVLQGGADGRHDGLALKAGLDAFGEVGIFGLIGWHRVRLSV